MLRHGAASGERAARGRQLGGWAFFRAGTAPEASGCCERNSRWPMMVPDERRGSADSIMARASRPPRAPGLLASPA